jgi:MSHA biogenesis protein MshI
MKWPWSRRSTQATRLALALQDNALAYVLAEAQPPGRFRILRHGVERPGPDSAEAYARRLAGMGFKGHAAVGMLRLPQYQIVQIEAPAVPPEELRTAARWQIRDMVSQHIDDLTLDVLRVGDEQARSGSSLFVVAGQNEAIRALMETAQILRCAMGVIDVQDLAQRNLQSLCAADLGVGLDRAHAAVTLSDDGQALLTICARDELFYTRRIDLGAGFAQLAWGGGMADASAAGLSLVEVGPDAERSQRLVVEIQRTLDLWDRTWPSLPLDRLLVYAGARTQELAGWLQQQLGQAVMPLDVSAHFEGFEGGSEEDHLLCWPLLGVLLRDEGRTL